MYCSGNLLISSLSLVFLFFIIHDGEAFKVSRDVKFELHTRQNHSENFEILFPDRSLHNSGELTNFDFNKSTRIFVHGFNTNRELMIRCATAFLKHNDFNCIAVNWMKGSNIWNYETARRRVERVGIALAELIDFLVDIHGSPLLDLLIFGHSLGAHICGVAGKNVKSMRIPVIIGLDPAYPFVTKDNINSRLHITDAEYVQVMHTNAGHLGLPYPVGHADFYPNWGRIQPGCSGITRDACSHYRSYEIYIESLSPNLSFDSVQCASYEEIKQNQCTPSGPNARMGGDDPKQMELTRGVYYIQTGEEPPYAL